MCGFKLWKFQKIKLKKGSIKLKSLLVYTNKMARLLIKFTLV